MSFPADSVRPSRYRYVILALLCFLAMITYMDRAANGSAKKAILSDLNKEAAVQQSAETGVPVSEIKPKYDEENDYFIVLMAFQLAYALFEIPSGWLGDTVGPRSTLLRVVLWWSVFVALTGFTGQWLFGGVFFVGYWALVGIQFLFGVGEAGAFPNIAKALYNWFPAADRGFAKSAVWMSARLMGGLTPFVWLLLTDAQFGGWKWNEAMWLFAGIAIFWCILFYIFFKNKPGEVKAVNAEERAIIDLGRKPPVSNTKVPWAKIFTSRNLWAVCGMYIVTNFCWYFLMYNHPRSMKLQFANWEVNPDGTPYAAGKMALALLSGAPLVIGMFGCLVGGLLSDRYIRRTGDRKWGRRLFGIIGYGGAGLCYLIAAGIKLDDPNNLLLYAGMLILMGFMNDLIMAPAWAVCQDIGQEYAATVSGTMNMVGNLVGAVSGILVTGLILKHFPETDGIVYLFGLYACIYFLGCGLWMLIDASKPIVPETVKPVTPDESAGLVEPG